MAEVAKSQVISDVTQSPAANHIVLSSTGSGNPIWTALTTWLPLQNGGNYLPAEMAYN